MSRRRFPSKFGYDRCTECGHKIPNHGSGRCKNCGSSFGSR